MIRELAEKRLNELKDEQRKGQQVLAELDGRTADLRQTLLRIGGAIQILEDLLESAE